MATASHPENAPATPTEPHPWIAERARHRPPRTADEQIGFNGRLAAIITKGVGTMWAFYLAALVMGGWMALSLIKVIPFDPYPFAFLLFLGNIVQLLLMSDSRCSAPPPTSGPSRPTRTPRPSCTSAFACRST
jgi:hypothetical protein